MVYRKHADKEAFSALGRIGGEPVKVFGGAGIDPTTGETVAGYSVQPVALGRGPGEWSARGTAVVVAAYRGTNLSPGRALDLAKKQLLEEGFEGEMGSVPVSNPVAGVPGGSIGACIAEMELRPGVRDPGALCAWIARKRGEYGGQKSSRSSKKSSARPSLGSILRKATS